MSRRFVFMGVFQYVVYVKLFERLFKGESPRSSQPRHACLRARARLLLGLTGVGWLRGTCQALAILL